MNLQAPFQGTLVCTQFDGVSGSSIRCTVITNRETVAGFRCDSVGTHGESIVSKPFVWSRGKLFDLPLLPSAKYGRVLDGNDSVLVGNVDGENGQRPVKWIPDPKKGWAKARLLQISNKAGSATRLGPDGSVYIESQTGISKVSAGKLQSVLQGDFHLAGLDSKGDMFGYRFKGRGYASEPVDPRPGWFTGSLWNPLPMRIQKDVTEGTGMLTSVNLKGIAVGVCNNQLAIWKGGTILTPLAKSFDWSFAEDINESGEVLGNGALLNGNKFELFLWSNNRRTKITTSVPDLELDHADQLNDKGAIAVVGKVGKERRLYLLKRQ